MKLLKITSWGFPNSSSRAAVWHCEEKIFIESLNPSINQSIKYKKVLSYVNAQKYLLIIWIQSMYITHGNENIL